MEENESSYFSNTIAKCQICLDLHADYLRRRWRQFSGYTTNAPHSCSFEELVKSAEHGCYGCALLNSVVIEIRRRFNIGFTRVEIEYLNDERLKGLSVNLWVIQGSNIDAEDDYRQRAKDIEGLRLELRTGSGFDDPRAEIQISSPNYEIFVGENSTDMEALSLHSAIRNRPHKSENTESDAAVEWTMKKLQQCKSSHVKCQAANAALALYNSVKLPTRVLDLAEDMASTVTPYVRLRKTHGEQGNYACLSHCWGFMGKDSASTRPLETTKSNWALFQEQIPFDRLPKTFQDAIIFTRKLGIRYLWIDSLCIIQNDPEDWAREAGKMATIFQNAIITLAAAASSNCQGGLFRQRKTTTEIGRDSMSDIRIYMREFPDTNFFDYQMIGDPIGRKVSPLMERAWVFQERLLSRRFLVFSPLELVWECGSGADSEGGHPWITGKHRTSLLEGSLKEVKQSWEDLIEEYTFLKLSYPSDVLPAVAGLAKRMSPLFEGDYLAGLWRCTFISNLLWIRKQTMLYRENQQPKDNRLPCVPSWSWASPGTPVEFLGKEIVKPLCDVVDVSCSSKTGDVFVEIDEAHAVLSGYLLPMEIEDAYCGVVIKGMAGGSSHGFQRYRDFNWSSSSSEQLVAEDKLYGLAIAAVKRNAGLEHNLEIIFLILRQKQPQVYSKHQQDGVFERVGIGHLDLLTLKPYQYILEGKELLANALERQVQYGESKLGKDGSYEERRERSDQFALDHSNQAMKTFQNEGILLDFGKWRTMYGLPHLQLVRRQLDEERTRLKEWHRRIERGEHQAHKRATIVIV